MGTETQEMVEEEVVQFVRADQVLCLLLDVAVLVCRDQFGADRRVDDIQQGEAGGIVHLVIGNPFDQVFDQCFRDAAVHAVHRHMVAVVGRPAECQFGESPVPITRPFFWLATSISSWVRSRAWLFS